MLKSKVFVFNEKNLIEDIERFKMTGRDVYDLQCNLLTAYIWTSTYGLEWDFSFSKMQEYNSGGVIGKFQGIPIRINDALDNGTVGIR